MKLNVRSIHLIKKLHLLSGEYENADQTRKNALKVEMKEIVNILSTITKETYDAMAPKYSELRSDVPSEQDAESMDSLIHLARERLTQGKLGDEQGRLHILDVGTGHGRDLQYLVKQKENIIFIETLQIPLTHTLIL